MLYAEAVFHRWRGSYEKLAAVIAPSEFMRRAVVGARFPPSKVHILRNGIDTESIRSSPRDAGYVLYVGRLSNGKGIESLLEAHAPLSGEIPLVVAGTGPLEADLRADYPEVRFLGHLVGSALERVLQHASVVVIPSNWYENAPMSVLEAMAHGKPVVGANIGGIPEMIHHEETGLLFPPENREALRACLVRLIADPALRKRLGTAGRKLAESKFSLERHNQALLNLYSKILTRTDGEPQPAAMALPQRMGPWT